MWSRTFSLAFFTALLAASSAQAQDAGPDASPLPIFADSTLTAPDSLVAPADSSVVIPDSRGGHVLLPVREIRGTIIPRTTEPEKAKLSATRLQERDALTVADFVPLVPDARAATNSRGETVLMLRGAPERQIVIEQDGIPLTLPWDERADLSLLPSLAIDGVAVTRGTGSVLAPPNSVAGLVQLETREQKNTGSEQSLRASLGEANLYRGEGLVSWATHQWNGVASIAHETRDGFLLPKDYQPGFNQEAGRQTRTNSAFERSSALLKLGRDWQNGSRVAMYLQGYDASRSVPPEDHIQDARFWRYPKIQRGLLGLAVKLRPSGGDRWRADLNVSLDRFHQEIRAYDDANYDSPALAPGVDYETDDDATGFFRLQLDRRIGESDRLSLVGSSRYTRHTESLVYDGPEQRFSEWLSQAALQWERQHEGGVGLRLGVGVDAASTPQTGDKPARAAQAAPALSVRASKEISARSSLYLEAARRSRFPSLRELYSGALGRFEPNLDLKPEDQNSLELGGTLQGRRWSMSSSAFADFTRDGIERVSLSSGKFIRVNAHQIRVLGLELGATWRPYPGARVQAHHSFLHSRAKEDGSFNARVEDRPSFLSYLELSQRWRFGARLAAEAIATGARYSQDLDTGGLRELPSQIQWNLRASYQFVSTSSWLNSTELYVRVDNVFDTLLYYQLGLPEPGRTLRLGINAEFGD
jgi:iron complex outermembrane receptor protein